MLTHRIASLAAAIVVGGGTLLAVSGADAGFAMNRVAMNGMSLNGVALNGIMMNGIMMNGATDSAVASQGFDFNNVSVQTVSWTGDCPLPLDRGKAVVCALGTSAEKRP